MESSLYPSLKEIESESESRIKHRLLKCRAYDLWTNGGNYFFKSIRPSYDLRTRFSKIKKKQEHKEAEKEEEKNLVLKYPKDHPRLGGNFISYYKYQFGVKVHTHEDLMTLNKFTTPKENVKLRSNFVRFKKDRDSLTAYDIPISLLSINPLGSQYLELMSLSIALYVKLKNELRTMEFINKHLNHVKIEKANTDEEFMNNHHLLSNIETDKENSDEEDKDEEHKEEEVKLDSTPLNKLFKRGDKFKDIQKALTCSNAKRGYDYETLEYFGDAIIALLSRFETVLFNPESDENELDMERLAKESNLNFERINNEFKLYKYMIGGSDTATFKNKIDGSELELNNRVNNHGFVPPSFNQIDFYKMLSLKNNEIENKLLFLKSLNNKAMYKKQYCLNVSRNEQFYSLYEWVQEEKKFDPPSNDSI